MYQRRAEGSDPFLWAKGVPGAKMHRMMSVQYGNSVMLQQIVCELIERLKNGRTNVQHEEGAGRSSTSIADAKTERVCDTVLKNRRVTIGEVAHRLPIGEVAHQLPIEVAHQLPIGEVAHQLPISHI